MRNTTKVGYEPIPGYVLRQRLGAGGYGEVWLADAPGGLQKAIKLIYGTVEQSHATSELKSLERIRQVNHPFLLSLERIEIINDQVVIVTELAEGSLLDRYEHHRRKGNPGIPRSNLLDFLHDTADGLDFLAQKHSLQHLDVKPGNLLIIADRVKVADFGLVKDLHDRTQSLVSGLTPTYSAPEIFDGRPDYRSDQYSLAIVYMELLTGHLPFEGKTTAELARQHLTQQPNLEALPPADRTVVARALSKNPLDRFVTCRQLIEQLQKTRGGALPQVQDSSIDGRPKANSASRDSTDAIASKTITTSTASTPLKDVRFSARIDDHSVDENWLAPRSMFIGLGGLGCQSLLALRESLEQNCDSRHRISDQGWLAVDTTPETLDFVTAEETHAHLLEKHAIQIPIYKPADYRNAPPDLFAPLSRRWLYNIPKSLTTEGVRPLAILALLDHYEAVKAKLRGELTSLLKAQNADEKCGEPLRIYVAASLHGGTGSALVCEFGLMIRQIMRELATSHYRVCAVVSAATTMNARSANLPSAAAICCLAELTELMDRHREVSPIFHTERERGVIAGQPFDWVTLVDGGLHGSANDANHAIRSIASVVNIDSQTAAGAALTEKRNQHAGLGSGWLRTAATSKIRLSSSINMKSLARGCCEYSLLHASSYMNGPKGMATSSTNLLETKASVTASNATMSGDLPLTLEACEEFTRRLLRELGVVPATGGLSNLTASEEGGNLLSRWARRLARSDELVRTQLNQDLLTWKESIAKIVHLRVYNWKQVEQIQVSVIGGILDYCEHETESLVELFEPFSDTFGSAHRMRDAAVSYLKRFTEECVQLLNHFQREGKAHAKRLKSWHNSISAERALNDSGWDVDFATMPTDVQTLASRVNAVLESTLHREAMRILDDAADEACEGPGMIVPFCSNDISLQSLLSLTADLIPRVAAEIGIDPVDIASRQLNETHNIDDAQQPVALGQLASFRPALANFADAIDRIVTAPHVQTSMLKSLLSQQGFLSTSTMVPSARSQGSHVFCEAGNVRLQQLIANLWRPVPATLQLAERLRTRVDIDWTPASALLEDALEAQTSQPPSRDANHNTSDSEINVPPIVMMDSVPVSNNAPI